MAEAHARYEAVSKELGMSMQRSIIAARRVLQQKAPLKELPHDLKKELTTANVLLVEMKKASRETHESMDTIRKKVRSSSCCNPSQPMLIRQLILKLSCCMLIWICSGDCSQDRDGRCSHAAAEPAV
jgi:hypothetical protein